MAFKVLTTPSFDREARGIFGKDKTVADIFEKVIESLKSDPYNEPVAKLSAVSVS